MFQTSTSINTFSKYAAFSAVLFLLAFSSNPPNGRTGAPGDALCSGCHAGNTNIDGTLEVLGFPDVVQAGNTYELIVRASVTEGQAARAGFQLVVLDDRDGNAGDFENPGSNVGFESFSGRTYAEHRSAKNFSGGSTVDYTFDWVAPEPITTGGGSDEDSIKLYAVTVLADGNGGSTGDRVRNISLSAAFENPVSTAPRPLSDINIQTYPNPASDRLWISASDRASDVVYDLHVYSLTGQLMLSRTDYSLNDGNSIDVSQLMSGVYIMRLAGEDGQFQSKFIKQ